VAGNPGRHEPDRSQELWYPAIYDAINATGHESYVGMEFIPTGDPLTSLQAALDDLWASTQGATQ
jgi:hydroxypyruvate isomerase